MAGWAGFGKRLQEAMRERGFVNRKGDVDVTRFALSNGWIPNYIYRYINDQSVPDRPNLEKLGYVLGVSPAWLLFGDIAGVTKEAGVTKAPVPPRKRGPRALGCLVAALVGITTGGSAPRSFGSETPMGSWGSSYNVRSIMTSRRRKTTTHGLIERYAPHQDFCHLTVRAA